MSHRSKSSLVESEWRARQRRIGYADGRAGRPGKFADQHYQRGFREGIAASRRGAQL